MAEVGYLLIRAFQLFKVLPRQGDNNLYQSLEFSIYIKPKNTLKLLLKFFHQGQII